MAPSFAFARHSIHAPSAAVMAIHCVHCDFRLPILPTSPSPIYRLLFTPQALRSLNPRFGELEEGHSMQQVTLPDVRR
jgi:hypothetical protein